MILKVTIIKIKFIPHRQRHSNMHKTMKMFTMRYLISLAANMSKGTLRLQKECLKATIIAVPLIHRTLLFKHAQMYRTWKHIT